MSTTVQPLLTTQHRTVCWGLCYECWHGSRYVPEYVHMPARQQCCTTGCRITQPWERAPGNANQPPLLSTQHNTTHAAPIEEQQTTPTFAAPHGICAQKLTHQTSTPNHPARPRRTYYCGWLLACCMCKERCRSLQCTHSTPHTMQARCTACSHAPSSTPPYNHTKQLVATLPLRPSEGQTTRTPPMQQQWD